MAGTTREYKTDEIVVLWDAERCIHSARCIQGLPNVFRPADRPWIHIEEATADQLAETIARCPTGALHYRRIDGGPQEQPQTPPAVIAARNGPLFLRGDIEVLDQEGGVFRRDLRMALCRCGQSAAKPFCDGTHRTTGFTAG